MAIRILAIHYTPPGVIGGVEHILHQHIRLMTERGFRLQVVAGRAGDPALRTHVIPEIEASSGENALIEGELADGVVSPRFHRARESIKARLGNLVADADYVVVHNAFTLHFCLPLTAVLWELAARRIPGTMIAWCHDLAWTNPLYLPAMHAGYPWDLLKVPAPNVRYVTVSRERGDQLRGLWDGIEGDLRVIPNGIDVKSFLRLSTETDALVSRYQLLDRDLVLLLPVRITRRKNIEAAIRGVRVLKDRGLDIVFLVTGPEAPHHPGRSQHYLAELKALVADLDVAEQVVFVADALGRSIDNRTVSELYSVADILLFPSSQEGFGLPILEAGLARLPAVTAKIPIFDEVGGGDTWCFEVEAAGEQVADAIQAAADSPPARLFRRVRREYRWEALVDHQILPLFSREPRTGGR